MTVEAHGMRGRGLWQSIARAVCPRDERRWIDAMFAEMDAVEELRRLSWMLGALAISSSVIRLRAGLVPPLVWWGIIIGFHASVVFAIGGRSEYEGFGLDDDVFLRFAWVCSALVIGLVVLAINRIFSHVEATPPRRP